MRAGELRSVVQIEAPIDGRDGSGAPKLGYRTVATRRAAVEPLSATEQFEAHRSGLKRTCRVRLRYFDGLTSRHRFLLRGRVLEIFSLIDADERHVEHVALCQERD